MTLPVNVGNPDEHTIKEFATIIKDLTNSQSKVVNLPPTEDDPQRRRPDISRAKKEFDWEPRMGLTEGKNSALVFIIRVSRTKWPRASLFIYQLTG